MPQIAVSIPLYNKVRYIERALRSVLTQSVRDIEVVVVDDGSTDGSADVVRRIDDPRVRLVQQANAGPGPARNRGMRETTAPFICFLDADDEWLPGFAADSLRLLSEHPQAAAVGWAHRTGRGDDTNLPSSRQRRIPTGVVRVGPSVRRRLFRYLLCYFYCTTSLIRRDVVERYGGFYDRGHCTYGEDTWLWIQILLNHAVYVAMEPRAVVHYDASDLGILRKSVRPAKPFVDEPDPLRATCPPSHRKLLEHTIDYYALQHALELARWGRFADSREFMRRHPNTFTWREDFICERVWDFARTIIRGPRRETGATAADAALGKLSQATDKVH